MGAPSPIAKIPIDCLHDWSLTALRTCMLRATSTFCCTSLRLQGQVRFLVDTGAVFTVIHHTDAARLGIPVETLPPLGTANSAAGPLEIRALQGVTLDLITDNRRFRRCRVELPTIGVAYVPPDAPDEAREMASLLGMDVITCYRLVVDVLDESAYFDVFRSAVRPLSRDAVLG